MQPHTLRQTIQQQVELDYLLALPADYTPARRWPLMLFLHGSGQRGSQVDEVRKHGLPQLAAAQSLPFILVAPQCPAQTTWAVHLAALAALLDAVAASYAVDPERVHVTGLSMGGTGAWLLAATYPERFASLTPVCGDDTWLISDYDQLERLCSMPTWVFHGALDLVIPLVKSAQMVAALRERGGNVRLTVYPDVGHNAWNQAYATQDWYSWLSQQARTSA